MVRQSVISSNLSSVGYDALTATLEVAFRSGGIYQYFGVPLSTHAGLMSAASKGRYLRHWIKGRYRYRKVA